MTVYHIVSNYFKYVLTEIYREGESSFLEINLKCIACLRVATLTVLSGKVYMLYGNNV
jgi:hypothetical protein